MRKASIDYETRSACDLIVEGAYRYATDPTTDAICCSYTEDGVNVKTWWPEWVTRAINYSPDPPPDYDQYTAWNSQFDRLIWWYICEHEYGWPPTTIEQWVCIEALARSNGLPGKLENAAIALNLNTKKDKRGQELIKLLSWPNGGTRYAPTFNEDPVLLLEMIDYCEQDAIVAHGMQQVMRPFLPHELKEFHVNEHINDHGIGVDIDFCKKAMKYGSLERDVLERQLFKATNKEVERPTQYQRVKKWLLHGYAPYKDEDGKGPRYAPLCEFEEYGVDYCPHGAAWGGCDHKDSCNPRISPEALKIMTVYKGGERKISLDKAIRAQLMDAVNTDGTFLTDEALEVIQLTDLAGKSSVAKYKRMVQREVDGRVNGAYMFAGAAGTGRFSAHGVQPHNMVRDCVDNFEESLASLDSFEETQVIHTLSKMMRPTIIAAPDHKLFWSDWSNVEGRGMPYLANTKNAEKKLDMFRHQDAHPDEPDVYERMTELLGLDDRQTGKVAELSLQFGGSIGAFSAMARNYGVKLTDSAVKVVIKKWRAANPWAEPFWYALKDAAWSAMVNPDQMFPAGRVKYFYTEHTHNGLGTLWCQLPSGRLIAYVNPKFERVPCPWNPEETMVELTAIKANFKPKAGETEWPRHKLWYGVLAENITQAFCADIMRDKLVLFHDSGYKTVLHTHDEIINEDRLDIRASMLAIMQKPPAWCPEFPLAADMNMGQRYKQNES